MPSRIALILCCVLVIFFIKLTMRKIDRPSVSLWIPTLWMLVSISRPVARWFVPTTSYMDNPGDTGSSLDQAFFGILIILSLIVLSKRQINLSRIRVENYWLLVLFAYMGLSVLWSPFPLISFKRWIRGVGGILAALIVMSEQTPVKSLEIMFTRAAYILIPFSLVLIKYFPALGVQYGRWSGARMPVGVCTQKNGLGALCLICIYFLGWVLINRSRTKALFKDTGRTGADIVTIFMGLYLMKGADTAVYSATSLAVLLLGLVSYYSLSLLRANPERILHSIVTIFSCGSILYIVSEIFLGISPVSFALSLLGRDATLTGRTDIWDEVFRIVPRWSLIGVGYGGFWGLPLSRELLEVNEGHNGYLDTYVDLGIFGIIFLSLFIISLFRKLVIETKRNFEWGLFGISFLLMSLAYNYTESDFLVVQSAPWTVLIFLTLSLSGHIETLPQAEFRSISSMKKDEPKISGIL